MKKLGFVLMLTTLLFSKIPQYTSDEYTKIYKDYNSTYIAKMVVEGIRQGLPIEIDTLTTVIKAESKDKSLLYTKQIDTKDKQFSTLWKKDKICLINSQVLVDRDIACAPSSTRYFIMHRGISIVYTYIDKQNTLLFQHTIGKEQCLKNDERNKRY